MDPFRYPSSIVRTLESGGVFFACFACIISVQIYTPCSNQVSTFAYESLSIYNAQREYYNVALHDPQTIRSAWPSTI